jgi:hypothetical protein
LERSGYDAAFYRKVRLSQVSENGLYFREPLQS